MKKIRTSVFLIVLALVTIYLNGCATGGINSNLNVSENFLNGLIEEIPTIENCCPYTMEVIKDWIAQNDPN